MNFRIVLYVLGGLRLPGGDGAESTVLESDAVNACRSGLRFQPFHSFVGQGAGATQAVPLPDPARRFAVESEKENKPRTMHVVMDALPPKRTSNCWIGHSLLPISHNRCYTPNMSQLSIVFVGRLNSFSRCAKVIALWIRLPPFALSVS